MHSTETIRDYILPGSDIANVVKYLGLLQGDARYIQVTVNGRSIDCLELVKQTFPDGSTCYAVNVVLEA